VCSKLKAGVDHLQSILGDGIAEQVKYWSISRTEGDTRHLSLDLFFFCVISFWIANNLTQAEEHIRILLTLKLHFFSHFDHWNRAMKFSNLATALFFFLSSFTICNSFIISPAHRSLALNPTSMSRARSDSRSSPLKMQVRLYFCLFPLLKFE
jgi:hypothetical protein